MCIRDSPKGGQLDESRYESYSYTMRAQVNFNRIFGKQAIAALGGAEPVSYTHLAAILVGHDGGSETYVAAKVKACEVCGFKSSLIRYEADAVSYTHLGIEILFGQK